MALILVLVERFQATQGEYLIWKGFRVLALDGTTINLDNWKKLSAHYGKSKNGKGKQKTQARRVMLQSPLTRLPIAYQVAPLKVGETTLALQMLTHVQRGDLLLLDRGFFSFGLHTLHCLKGIATNRFMIRIDEFRRRRVGVYH